MDDLKKDHKRALLTTENDHCVLKCPECGKPLLVEENGKKKLKTRIVIFLKNKTLAKCKYCRKDIEVPVKFDLKSAKDKFATDESLSIDPDSE
jgi:ssDNA-binding Zn-finger/Zn-ribbon topoisomerase 1